MCCWAISIKYRFNGKLNDAFSAQCRIVCLIEVFLVLVLYNPAVDNLQSCSFLERIPVGKRQCGQNLTLFRQRSLYFLVTLYYISLLLYSSFLSAVGDNSKSRVLQERSCLVPCQLGHCWVTAQCFWQVFIFLGFPHTSEVVQFKTH